MHADILLPSCSQIALYAARDIAAGEQLTAHYGDPKLFHRDYQPGAESTLRKKDIAREAMPATLRLSRVCSIAEPTRAFYVHD